MWMYAVMSKSTGCLYGEWEAESPDVAAARCLDYYGTRRDRPSREDMDIIPMSRTKPGPKPGPPGSQRTARLVVRVTPAELSAYQAAAGRAGVSMGEWVRARLAAGDWSANRSHDWSEVNGRRCARCHVRRTDEGASAFCTQQGAWTAAAEKEREG